MRIPNVNIKETFIKGKNAMKDTYKNTVKPALMDGVKYTKDLAMDTVAFVKKNPKKTGLIAAGVAAGVALIATFTNLVKKNRVKSEHIEHQREIINALKEDIEDRQVMMDSLHDAVAAAHSILQKKQA